MQNKILLCGSIIVIMALIVVFGYTNARYYSTTSMTGDLDYVKTKGEISIYQPESINGYIGSDDGTGFFSVSMVPTNYASIHYKVTNKVDNEINEDELSYYIRIIAEDGSDNIPIEYDVHEYNNPRNVLNLEAGVGYGPFTLSAFSEKEQLYSIRANYNSKDNTYASSTQNLKVQMVKKRTDGTLKIIDDAPLNMKYIGPKTHLTVAYYLYGTNISIGTEQILYIEDNFTIDFNNSNQLNYLGITLPYGYKFHDVRGTLPGYSETATSVTIPEGYHLEGYSLEVYLTSNTKVALQLDYYDYTNYTINESGNRVYAEINDSHQILEIDRGILIDFTDEAQRKKLGIVLPVNYSLQGLDGDLVVNKYTDTSIAIPYIETDYSYKIGVYMRPNGTAIVNLSYYNSKIDLSQLLNTQTLSSVDVGTEINFEDSNSLTSLGITLPSGYKFNSAYCTELDNTGTGHNEFMIPYNGANQTYNIDVVLDEVAIPAGRMVTVKFYNSSAVEILETTVEFKSDDTYDFSTDICRALCPELNNMYSFVISVANQSGQIYDIGDTGKSGSVTVDYNKTYTSYIDFRLSDPGSYVYITAW